MFQASDNNEIERIRSCFIFCGGENKRLFHNGRRHKLVSFDVEETRKQMPSLPRWRRQQTLPVSSTKEKTYVFSSIVPFLIYILKCKTWFIYNPGIISSNLYLFAKFFTQSCIFQNHLFIHIFDFFFISQPLIKSKIQKQKGNDILKF